MQKVLLALTLLCLAGHDPAAGSGQALDVRAVAYYGLSDDPLPLVGKKVLVTDSDTGAVEDLVCPIIKEATGVATCVVRTCPQLGQPVSYRISVSVPKNLILKETPWVEVGPDCAFATEGPVLLTSYSEGYHDTVKLKQGLGELIEVADADGPAALESLDANAVGAGWKSSIDAALAGQTDAEDRLVQMIQQENMRISSAVTTARELSARFIALRDATDRQDPAWKALDLAASRYSAVAVAGANAQLYSLAAVNKGEPLAGFPVTGSVSVFESNKKLVWELETQEIEQAPLEWRDAVEALGSAPGLYNEQARALSDLTSDPQVLQHYQRGGAM